MHEITTISNDALLHRYTNDHDIFQELLVLLKSSFDSTNENGYISFATDAINVIYHVSVFTLNTVILFAVSSFIDYKCQYVFSVTQILIIDSVKNVSYL